MRWRIFFFFFFLLRLSENTPAVWSDQTIGRMILAIDWLFSQWRESACISVVNVFCIVERESERVRLKSSLSSRSYSHYQSISREWTVVRSITCNWSSRRARLISFFLVFQMKGRTMFRSLLFVSLLTHRAVFAFDLSKSRTKLLLHRLSTTWLGTCRAPLGIQSGAIPDASLQASSALDLSLGPQTARIRSAIEGGGWCPTSLIDSHSEEYLQINFLNLTVITLIETQGRHGPFQVCQERERDELVMLCLCFFFPGGLCWLLSIGISTRSVASLDQVSWLSQEGDLLGQFEQQHRRD